MTERYFDIYRFVHTWPGRITRFGPISVIAVLFIITEPTYEGIVNAVASFGIFLINEIFLSAKVMRTKPEFTIYENQNDFVKSMVFRVRNLYVTSQSSYDVIQKIKTMSEIKFFIEKSGIDEIKKSDISKEELLKQAKELTEFVKGDYITEIDLFASYVLLSEDESKMMVDKDLVHEDIVNITYWTRKKFKPDNFEKKKMVFLGEGVFDSLVYGWNYELKKYTRDLTNSVFSSNFRPVISGREKEFKQLVLSLSKEKDANAILVGEAGVGKTSIVEYLAYEAFLGNVPGRIYHKRIYELMVDRLLSGVSNAGELEERLSYLLADFTHSENTVIFIQNIENIFGGGGFDFDMSGALLEYLKGGKLQIIGTATPSSYAAFIESKGSARELFDVINIEEFDEAKSLLLLSELAAKYEKSHRVSLLYSALKQIVLLSPMYFPDRYYPGRAVSLLEEVIAAVKIKNKKIVADSDVLELVKSKTNVALAEPTGEEKEKLLHLEEKLHARVIGQDEAINAVADAMRRVRAGFEEKARPIGVFLFLGPTGVGKTETAKTLAREYFGDEKAMIRLDMSEMQSGASMAKIIGEQEGSGYVANSLTEEVSKKPYSLILLDEFEKADKNILNIFLQIFDEGKVSDAKGSTISFKNSIIIATSNAGTEIVRENPGLSKNELIDALLKNNIFSPELINRFDEVILFRELTEDEVVKIAKILLSESAEKLSDNQIVIEFDDKVAIKVAHESLSREFGARNVRRYVEENVEQFVSKLILEDRIKKGDKIILSVDSSGNFIIN